MKTGTRIVITILVLAAGAGSGLLWNLRQASLKAETDAAYARLLPEGSWPISDRHYEMQLVFTDGVKRYRFDGASEKLVEQLVARYALTRAEGLASTRFKVPRWWQLPEGGVRYLRGGGHEYTMLFFDPEAGRVFFEIARD